MVMKKIIIFILLVLLVLVVYVFGKGKNLDTKSNEANTFSAQEKPILEEFSSDNMSDQEEIYIEGLRKHSPPPPEGMR